MQAVVDRDVSYATQQVDEPLLARLRAAVPQEETVGHTTLLRRDGEASHFTAIVRASTWQDRPALAVLLLGADLTEISTIDDLWWSLLARRPAAEKV